MLLAQMEIQLIITRSCSMSTTLQGPVAFVYLRQLLRTMGMAHGQRHQGFTKSHKIVSRLQHIRGLIKLLGSFIHHCLKYWILKTRRHPPHGALQPTESPNVTFYTLTIDFILAFLVLEEGFNAAMSVTCKYPERPWFLVKTLGRQRNELGLCFLDWNL